jgi:hypothetical protein
MNFKNVWLVIVLVGLIVVAVVVGPLIVIWSLNTLFPILAIPYNIWTWLAVIGINASIRGIFYNLKVSNK